MLRQKLDAWLKETGARIPQSDSRFDAKKQQQLRNAAGKQMQGLEKRHADYLKPDYKPNKTW